MKTILKSAVAAVVIIFLFALVFGISCKSKNGRTFVSQENNVTSKISLITDNRAIFGILYGTEVSTITGGYQEKDGNIMFFWDDNAATGIAPKFGKIYDNKIIIINLYGGKDDVYLEEEN